MPQPVTYNPGTPVSGSIQENSISYVVDGQNRNYRGGFGGLSWMSEVPAANNVIFIGNSVSLGRGPANIPLFYPSYNNSAANIIYTANTLPGSPRNFTTTGSAYDWAATNNFFINNSNNPIPRIDADGMVLYLDASQPTSYPQTGTTWYDASGFGNNGTLTNGATYVDEAIRFDGVDDQVSANNVSVSYLSSSTVDVIFKVGGYSGAGKFALAGYNFNGGGYSDSTTGIIYISDGGTIASSVITTSQVYVPVYSTTTVVLGRYYQATLYKDTVNGVLKLYVNGKLESTNNFDTTTYAQWPNPGTFIGNNNFAIGYYNSNNWGSGPYFSGSIANTKLYSKLLSDSEIQQNYFQGNIVTGSLVFMVDANNLVSYPKSGTLVYSLTGSLSGSLINGVGYNTGNGGSWVFDGTDDYINFGPLAINSPLSFTNGNFTLEHWIKPTSLQGGSYYGLANMILLKGPASTFNYATQVVDATSVRFYHRDTNEGLSNNTFTVPNLINVYTHLVFVINSAGTQITLYVNGILQQTQNLTGNPITPYANDELLVGGYYTQQFTDFIGNIYTNRIYNKALTSDEVQQNYQATKDKFLGENIVTNGLVLNLDSANKDSYPGTGTTWTDLSGNGYNGTLTNGPSFLSNQNGGIFNFDGVDDYTIITPPTTYSEYTIQFFCKWISSVGFSERLFGCDAFGTYTIFNPYNVGFHYNPLGGSPPSVTLSSGVNVGFGNWCNVAVTVSATSTNVVIYVNGISSNSWGVLPSANLSANIFLGAQNTSLYSNCLFGNFQIYNRALSATEITQNYNAQKIRFGL